MRSAERLEHPRWAARFATVSLGVLGKVCHNNSRIPPKTLRNIMRIIEARRSEIIDQWVIYFGSAKFYC